MVTPDDRQLADIVRRIDGPIALDDELEQRLFGRTLAAFDDAVEEMALDGGSLVEPTTTVTLDTPRPVDRRQVQPVGRPRTPLLVAASVIAVVGLAAALLLTTRRDDAAQVVPATAAPDPGSVSVVATLQPTSAVPLPDAGNTLGYLPLTGSTFRFGGAVASSSDWTIVERTGDFDLDPSGTSTIDVRRAIEVGSSTSGNVVTIRLTVTENGTIIAPLEYLDPIEFGGACVGGRVPIGPSPTETSTEATCDGRPTTVEITASVGAAEPLALLDQPVDATPVTYSIMPAGDTERRVTLWFADQGLVRRTHADPRPRDLDLDLDNLIRMEGTP